MLQPQSIVSVPHEKSDPIPVPTNETADPPCLSLSEHIYQQLSVLIDTNPLTTTTSTDSGSSISSSTDTSSTSSNADKKTRHIQQNLLPYFQPSHRITNTSTSTATVSSSSSSSSSVPTSTTTTTTTTSTNTATTTTDAYITLYGNVHQGHLPAIPNWNTTFRKAYTILFWIRIRTVQEENNIENDNTNTKRTDPTLPKVHMETMSASTAKITMTEPTVETAQYKRILYRFSSAPLSEEHNMDHGTGICVTCSQWKLLPSSVNSTSLSFTGVQNDAENEMEETSTKTTPRPPLSSTRQLQTTLTAYALPYNHASAGSHPTFGKGLRRSNANANHQYASYTQQNLSVNENQWHLIGCTHIYPYLKRPVWTVCIDGANTGNIGTNTGTGGTTNVNANPTNELQYPVLSDISMKQKSTYPSSTIPSHLRSMEYCTVFQNITAGGAIQIPIPTKTDDCKTASELAHELKYQQLLAPTIPIACDVAAISIYPEAISPVIQAIIAEAGPTLVQQKYGHIIPTLPPVPNWSKGCSLAGGPKVGIPLTVHNAALEIQQLSSSVQFACSIVVPFILLLLLQIPQQRQHDWRVHSSRFRGKPTRHPALDWSNPIQNPTS
jgi:hypothetical protein